MSGHRRVKGVDYTNEDYEDYDEDYEEEGQEEVSAEDREQLRQGTIKVREALGSDCPVSDKDIQDALWHYFYDVDKSVTYLKNKINPPQPKKTPKQPSRFDQAADSAARQRPIDATLLLHPLELHPSTYFRGIPWSAPTEQTPRRARHRPMYGRGGLLGGSSKPSKLAALAAARRKKEEEKQAEAERASVERRSQSRSVALLDRLGGKPDSELISKENVSPNGQTAAGRAVSTQTRSFPVRTKLRSPSPKKLPEEPETPKEEEEKSASLPQIASFDLRATPSAFAGTILGNTDSRICLTGPVESSVPFASHFYSSSLSKSNPFAGPSPDDVVLKAQAKGSSTKSGTSTPKKSNGTKSVNAATEGVSAMSVEDAPAAPRVKSKNLNVRQEFDKSGFKNAASFVVIGHVDHGKSTLMGRLLYDLKIVDERSIHKLRKEADGIGKGSFALAWVMDQTSEERSRGVTVDIATNSFSTEHTNFTILDAPGHRDFIPNMIAGASQADFAVLVIDASTNSFESGLRGQTKEHALLVRSMGIPRLVIAINKMDTVSWSQDRFAEIQTQMTAFLSSAGFSPKNLTFVPCSGLTGENIVNPLPNATAPWYADGSTLIGALDTAASDPSKRALEKPFRLTISDVFRGGFSNPLSVSGRLDAGTAQVGETLLAQPSGEKCSIKGIEVDNSPVDWCVAGQIATLHLNDIDPMHLRAGDLLCDPKNPVRSVSAFTAKILAFEHVMPGDLDIHRGRLVADAKVSKLLAGLDKASGQVVKKKLRVVQPGGVARVVVTLGKPLPLEVGNRVVLRSEGITVAAGLLESVEEAGKGA